jgi:hypothetical protein
MGFDPFKEHYLKSNIFKKRVVCELQMHFKGANKLSESVIFLPDRKELIIVDYFLTIRRKYTANCYIDRKHEITHKFPDLSIAEVTVIYDFEHTRFNNNFDSDPDIKYKTIYVEDYYELNSINKLKKYEYLKLVVDERLSFKYNNLFDLYDLGELISELKNELKRRKISFFIGAGISTDSRLPNWDELLNSLYKIVLSKITPMESEDVVSFRNCYGDLLKQAEIIQTYLEDDISPIINNILYKNYRVSSNAKCLAKFICSHSEIVNKIISYNYDSNLEEELSKLNFKYNIVTTSEIDEGTFNIYHVHGFLPRKMAFKGSSEIVLSEFDFFKLFNKNNWQNKIQERALKNDICFIWGHSLNDPNLKRLLLKRRKNDQIYFFTKYENDQIDNKLNVLNRIILEDYYSSFNIKILWLEEWEHVNVVIDRLRNEFTF